MKDKKVVQFLGLRTEEELDEYIGNRSEKENEILEDNFLKSYAYVKSAPLKDLPQLINHPIFPIRDLAIKRLQKG